MDAELYARAGIGLAGGAWKYYIRPEITAKRTWAAIGAMVVAHEILCPPGELLSEEADKWVERHPVLFPLVAFTVAAHITNAVNERYDPIHRGLKLLKP